MGSHIISITQGGYLHLQYEPKSYHRLLWIIIAYYATFGDTYLPLRDTPSRKLIIHHTKGQRKYIYKLRHLTQEFNLLPVSEAWNILRHTHHTLLLLNIINMQTVSS